MKKFLFLLIVIVFFILSFYMIEKKGNNIITIEETTKEKRAVFLSYIELGKYLRDKNEKESKNNIKQVLDNMKNNKFNMLLLHVRMFSDAIYPSEIFPVSDYVKVNNKLPNYDILDYIIKESKLRNIEVHAWINPYRISNDTNIEKIQKNTIIHTFLNNGDAKVVKDKGIFYNPSSDNVKKLIVDGIREIINNYEVDGIHFDDYFYPSDSIDLEEYEKYIDSGGTLSLSDFRYNNVLSLIKDVYYNVKMLNPEVEFGISPEGNIDNNYNNHYLDVKKLLKEDGYIDYIMPQIYFGFENKNRPFIKNLKEWNNLIKNDVKLIPALALYKSGETDKYAGSGLNEWIENSDIISRQIQESRKVSKYNGFSLFRYDYLFNDKIKNDNLIEEFNNLKEVLE